MFKKLLPCIGKYKKYAIITPLLMMGEVLMEILIPLIMAKIIDVGIQNHDLGYVVRMGLLMMLMSIISLFFGGMGGRTAALAGMGFGKGLRQKLFYKVQDFSFANVDKFSQASLVTRLTTDVTSIQNMFMMVIRTMIRSPLMLIGALILAIRINGKLSLVFFVVIPILALTLVLVAILAYPKFREMFTRYDTMNATVQENLTGIRVVKAFVREKFENEKFEHAVDMVRRTQVKAERILIINMPVMQLCMYGCLIAVLWFGGQQILVGKMQTGDLISFLTYISQILMSLIMLSMIFMTFVMSRAAITRIGEVLDEEVDVTDGAESVETDVKNGEISFRDVSFSYEKKQDNCVLEHINLEIKSGETVGIIGGTGSSKTTLVQLIPRLYDVTSGALFVGGHNVKEYELETLRNQVAMVLQNNVLFTGTIKENLKWGNPDASDEEIREACKAAQADDFIQSFPEGYETDLGQGGVNVSGGQKQRLCIARALLKKPKIIILDDSTSAVDTATDRKIRDAFREKLSETTTIIIAQRVTSVADADKIVVMDDGKINAIGTHEELLKTNQIYREVYESQQKGAE